MKDNRREQITFLASCLLLLANLQSLTLTFILYFPTPRINTSVIVPYSDSRSVAMISARKG